MKHENSIIPDEEILIEQISEKHTEIINEFSTNLKELKDFLVEDALKNQEMHISKTYLWIHKPTGKIVAYISVLTDSIRIQGTHLRDYFLEKGIEYKGMPALKIGRLCVDERCRRRGIGTKMIAFAIRLALDIDQQAACRFISVDAKRDKMSAENSPVKFYIQKEFRILKEREKGTIAMYLDMLKILKRL